MNKLLSIILLILFTACSVMIGENGYRLLKESQLQYIKPFDSAVTYSAHDNAGILALYEINSNDIHKVLLSNQYTWLHFWTSWCHGPYCENVNYFQTVSDQLKDRGVQFMLVSLSYDFAAIREKIRNSAYDKPVFILQDSHYGHKVNDGRLKFHNEFKNLNTPEMNYGFSDYFFRDSTLIFCGKDLNKHMVDSLMAGN